MIENPTIHFLGITFSEPVTAITSLCISIIAAIIFFRLQKIKKPNTFLCNWKYFFMFMGVATCVGAIAHGLKNYFAPEVFNIIWMSMQILSAIASFFSVKAALCGLASSSKQFKLFNTINVVLVSLFIAATIAFNNFEIVKIYIGISVVVILVTHIRLYKKIKYGNDYIIAGMLVSLLTVIVHSAEISISVWMNYKDISHVIMMVGLLLLYNGVIRIFAMSSNKI